MCSIEAKYGENYERKHTVSRGQNIHLQHIAHVLMARQSARHTLSVRNIHMWSQLYVEKWPFAKKDEKITFTLSLYAYSCTHSLSPPLHV